MPKAPSSPGELTVASTMEEEDESSTTEVIITSKSTTDIPVDSEQGTKSKCLGGGLFSGEENNEEEEIVFEPVISAAQAEAIEEQKMNLDCCLPSNSIAIVINNDKNSHNDDEEKEEQIIVQDSFGSRHAKRLSHRPWLYFGSSLLASIILAVIGLTVGDFQVIPENIGWGTRGTEIGNRQTQSMLVRRNQNELLSEESNRVWEDLLQNVCLLYTSPSPRD